VLASTDGNARGNPLSVWFKVDLHAHTTWSDGKNTTQEMALKYSLEGYDAVFFTEHDKKSLVEASLLPRRWEAKRISRDYDLRIHTNCLELGRFASKEMVFHHITAFNLKKFFQWTDQNYLQIIQEIHRQSGIAILAHVNWYIEYELASYDTMKNLITNGDLPVDVIEFTRVIGNQGIQFWDNLLTSGYKITCVGSTDAHVSDIGLGIHIQAIDNGLWSKVLARSTSSSQIAQSILQHRLYFGKGDINVSFTSFDEDGEMSGNIGDTILIDEAEILRFEVDSDSQITKILLISENQTVATWHPLQTSFTTNFEIETSGYYRLSIFSEDGFVYTNPIWIVDN